MTSKKTQCIFQTDGMLIRELMMDKTLSWYSYVFIDEAHERTLNTDILLGTLKELVAKRKDTDNPLWLILMSSTIEIEKFFNYF